VEATKKTSATRAALLVVAAISMLLSGLFVATASRSDASPPPACPDGFTLTADQKNCFQRAVVSSADNPNSCAEGLITPDGSKCYIAARLIPQEGTTDCPKGFSPDDSLGGICAKFEPADQKDPGCPEGSRGVKDGCYIRVAKGPRGTLVCNGDGTLNGDICVVEGNPPTRGTGTCPVAADIVQSGCYRLVSKSATTPCVSPYTAGFAGTCKRSNPNAVGTQAKLDFTCPVVSGTGTFDDDDGDGDGTGASMTMVDAQSKIESCFYVAPTDGGDCPANSEAVAGECRVAVTLILGDLQCETGFGLIGSKCIAQSSADVPAAVCPTGSFEDADGVCRKPVANAAGAFFCKDAAAALNGKSCVTTAPFTVDFADDAYVCAKGDRAVIGEQVLCFLGDADKNVTEGPSCLQGVLSTDNQYCVVPRIDTAPAAAIAAAPVPSFTG